MERGSKKVLLIVDSSSVLFSCFIFSEKIRNLMLNPKLVLYTPDWAIYELLKYFDEKIVKRVKKKGVSREELMLAVYDTIQKLIVIPKELYINNLSEAIEIARQFDEKDAPFIALALKLNVPIWTGDKKLIEFGLKTGKYLALDTQAVEKLLKGESLNDIKEELKNRYL